MAGANYMGGRRNAMKARSRDTNGKLQKSHFGKQRLNILTKGLSKTTNMRSCPRPLSSGAGPEISLAHAKRPLVSSLSLLENPSSPFSSAYKQSSCTPSKTAKKSSPGTKSSSSPRSVASRSSKILMEIDITEPFCFRAEVKRLLAHPDFAGLTDNRQQVNNATPYTEQRTSPYPGTSGDVEQEHISRSPGHQHCRDASVGYTEYYEPLVDNSSSESDFDPMPYDEDSGYAEGTPVEIRLSPLRSYGPSRKQSVSRDLSERVLPSYPELPVPGQQVAYFGGLAVNERSTSPTDSSHISTLPNQGMGVSSDLDSSSSGQHTRFSEHFAKLPKQSSFLERMSAKYPYVSASISSDVSVSWDITCTGNYGRLPRLMSPFSEPQLSGFISDVSERPPSPIALSETAVATTLLDAVGGKLFECSDPWEVIKWNLSSPSTIAVLSSADRPASGIFEELRVADDRCGVGFRERQPNSSPLGSSEVPTLQATLIVPDDSLHHATHCPSTLASPCITNVVQSNPPIPSHPPQTLGLSPGVQLTFLHESRDPLPVLSSSGNEWCTVPGTRIQRQGSYTKSASPPTSPPTIPRSLSPARELEETYVLSPSVGRQEAASLQELPTPLMAHSSPRIVCTAADSESASASAVLPENVSTGDAEEGEKTQRQEALSPIQSTPKETVVAGPLLFDDEWEDSDDM